MATSQVACMLPNIGQHKAAMQGTQDLWTFYADAAVAFEKAMSLVRGIYIDESQMDHDGELEAMRLPLNMFVLKHEGLLLQSKHKHPMFCCIALRWDKSIAWDKQSMS